ncbi:MAG: hypothetical protein ABI785_07315 [Gemmatimonadales bacterium]
MAAVTGTLASVMGLAPPALPIVLAQDFRDHARAEGSYLVTRLYDRVTDSTRVSASLSSSARPFGLGSRVWLVASFTFPGRRLLVPPEFAVLSLESWTPARGGWAFAHPRELRVEAGKARIATIPAAGYVKRPVHLFDGGRREELSFRIKADELTTLVGEPELVLKAGGATVRLDGRRMTRLRALVKAMTDRETQ